MPDTIDTKKALREALMQGASVAGFGEANEFVSDSNAFAEDQRKVMRDSEKAKMALKAAMKAATGARGSLSEAAREQAAMEAYNAPIPIRRLFDPSGMKGGGKVSKSGRSYRGYGKARIPS